MELFVSIVDSQYVPFRRSYSLDHSVDSGNVILFGGCADEKSYIYGDLWLYDISKNRWGYVYCEEGSKAFPPPRYGHSSVYVPKSRKGLFSGCLVIFGGRTFDHKLLSDIWAWNEERNEWRLIDHKGDVPSGTCYASLTLLEDCKLVLFGGQTEKSPRGSKLMFIFDEGVWHKMEKSPKDPRRFRHYAWYNAQSKVFSIYGGISGHSWHVDVCRVTIEGNKKSGNWKFLGGSGVSMVSVIASSSGPATGAPVPSIQSEMCVVLDSLNVLVVGASYAFVLTLSPNSSFYTTRARTNMLPKGFHASSAGINACLVKENQIFCWNLLPKIVSPILSISYHQSGPLMAILIDAFVPPQTQDTQICHQPPFPPYTGKKGTYGIYLTEDGRWELWNGQRVSYFLAPLRSAKEEEKKSDLEEETFMSPRFSTRELDSHLAINLVSSEKQEKHAPMLSHDESDDDTMPLLYVRRHKKRTVLKRLIDLMMSWEKRGAVDYRKKRSKTVIADGGEEELDCFGIQEDKQKFDYRHFCFTMLRAALMLLFSLFYLFSRRFSVKGKIVMLMLGLVNASVVAIPVLAYSYPPASDLIGEPALLWAPLIFYVLLLLTHSTIEGNWRDTGGTAASLNYMDNYAGSVYTWQSSSEKSRTKRKMRGGELITCLIENEQSGLHDPWEYTFLTFVAAPILGLMKAGLFILVDFLLVSRQVPIDENSFVHFIYAWSMLLNFITTTLYLSLLGITAYIYRRQLILLRLVGHVTSKRDSAKYGIPYLPLSSVENVRLWAAMRSFAISEKSHLPLTSANVMAAFALLLTGVLWIVMLVLVFVDRDRRLLLVPINISLGFFAIVTFYYVIVCVRQHMVMNKQLRNHASLLGKESIRIQMAIETKGRKDLEPAQNVIRLLADLLKLDIQYFRFLGLDINQNSLNSMLGFFLTLSVASLTNIAIDLGSSGPSPIICISSNVTA